MNKEQKTALVEALLDAKAFELQAKAERIVAEEDLITALGTKNGEGSKSHKVGDYSVTIKVVVNRKLDIDVWEQVRVNIPTHLWPVQNKIVLDMRGVKYLQEKESEHYATLAKALTATPGKTSVIIK